MSIPADMAQAVTCITVTAGSNLAVAIADLLDSTSLGEHVVGSTRQSMFGAGKDVREYRPGPLPVGAWSSGEHALWVFLSSATGVMPVNLYGLAGQFAGTPESVHILNIIHALFSEGT